MTDYFRSSTGGEADKKACLVLTQRICNKCSDGFSGIGYSDGTFRLQAKEGSQPYQAPPRRVAYALLNEELDQLKKQQIIALLGVGEMLEWCNSFILVIKLSTSCSCALTQADLIKC